jgi:5-(carboxyamino)imidazole ribonucleotide mutase
MKCAIFFGSRSDQEKMKGAAKCLKEFGVDYEAHILSAHRVPEKLVEVIRRLESEGCEFIIAGAGLSAHLPGVVASKTILPVIGVPLDAAFHGMDSLFSIVQMPKAIPVATVGVNNSYNAAMLGVQMLAIKYPEIREKLVRYRAEMKEKFIADNSEGVEL